MHTYVHTYIRTAYVYTYIHTCMHACMRRYIHTYMARKFICFYIHTHANMDICEWQLYCLEYNPLHADVAQKVLQHAGLASKVTFAIGVSTETIPQVTALVMKACRLANAHE